jgi:hypothetical protein
MATLRHVWNFIAVHWFEILLAFLFAVIVDLLSFRSRIFALVHYIKNRRSERSVARLQERITQLEKQRDSYTSYLHSDKALYLANFHTLFGVLLVIAIAAALNVLSGMQPVFGTLPAFPLGLFSVLFYFLAVVLSIQGITTASLDTREKISESIAKLDSEIADLKKKLQAISKVGVTPVPSA